MYLLKSIFFKFELQIDRLTLKMTLKHQYEIERIIKPESHKNDVLHLFLFVFAEKSFSRNFDLQIDLLTLKMTLKITLNHQNNITNTLITSFICWKVVFSLI